MKNLKRQQYYIACYTIIFSDIILAQNFSFFSNFYHYHNKKYEFFSNFGIFLRLRLYIS
jgi:hypothetical protein